MANHIIAFNAGSSSVKFSLFEVHNKMVSLRFGGSADNIMVAPKLVINDENGQEVFRKNNFETGQHATVKVILELLKAHSNQISIFGIGHRVTCGGTEFFTPQIVDHDKIEKLKEFIPLFPLHQRYQLGLIDILGKLYANVPQVVCFDTGFHCNRPKVDTLFALPPSYANEGIIRYGFHGLSYEYIASIFLQCAAREDAKGNVKKSSEKENVDVCAKKYKRIVIAHLGNGASMCAMRDLQSVSTTMAFSALGDLVMSTRCGNLDVGVLLYLIDEKHMSVKDLTELLWKNSGLKGVSGISGDMRVLLKSSAPEAKEAVELFCYHAAKQLASLLPALGGLDAVVFTAGIGENSAAIRKNICDKLLWLGIKLDDKLNNEARVGDVPKVQKIGAGEQGKTRESSEDIREIAMGACKISAEDSTISVYVIHTDEDKIIAKHTYELSTKALQNVS